MDDTPLGRVVEVRSTNDPERIKNMTAVEKRLRNEWRQFRQKENNKRVQTATVTTQQLQDIFRSLAGGG